MYAELDYTFDAMGSEVRLLIGRPLRPGAIAPLAAADRERDYVHDFARRLTRFDEASELSALNRDRRSDVPASPLLCAAVGAAAWAAWRTDGLVDPTLIGALRRVGYAQSRVGARATPLAEALADAPRRRPAAPHASRAWRAIDVDAVAGRIRRPPGVEIDTGGTGKGLCADAVAHRLGGYSRYLVDCGGDIAVGGVGSQLEPWEIVVEHPLTRRPIGTLTVARGGLATSGLSVHLWRDSDGHPRHHLLDPRTGEPAWTGLVSATALAASALEAETVAKLALLRGPDGARAVLAEQGGIIVHDSGEAEVIGPAALRVADSVAGAPTETTQARDPLAA